MTTQPATNRPVYASDRFQIDRTYTRKHIVANSAKFAEFENNTAACRVAAMQSGMLDVVFEFARVNGGSKFTCFGLGRADRFPQIEKLK